MTMTRSLPRLLFVVALSLVLSASKADQPAASRGSTVIDFTIGGVGIDSTLRGRLPTAVEGHAPNAIPMRDDHLVVINNGASQVPTAYFRFLNKAVASIEVHYTALGVKEIAANMNQPMIDQLVARFGDYEQRKNRLAQLSQAAEPDRATAAPKNDRDA
jgi:hypothetical protein